jgi:hypothetical protein
MNLVTDLNTVHRNQAQNHPMSSNAMSVMDLGRGGVCLRRDLYKEDFAELNVGRKTQATGLQIPYRDNDDVKTLVRRAAILRLYLLHQ